MMASFLSDMMTSKYIHFPVYLMQCGNKKAC